MTPGSCSASRSVAYIVLIQRAVTAELRAVGIVPPPRQAPAAILVGGGLLRYRHDRLEDGGDIGDITEVAVRATVAMLGPRKDAPGKDAPGKTHRAQVHRAQAHGAKTRQEVSHAHRLLSAGVQ